MVLECATVDQYILQIYQDMRHYKPLRISSIMYWKKNFVRPIAMAYPWYRPLPLGRAVFSLSSSATSTHQ